MVQPNAIGTAPVHGHLAALVNHPGYYYLYALYADYAINNAWFLRQEYAALLAERLRVIQPLLGLVQPYRKSPALRLFTERKSRERFPPERANEAWRQLRQMIGRIGPPPGWPDAAPPPMPGYAIALPAHLPRRKPAGGASAVGTSAAAPRRARKAAPKRRKAKLPKPPIVYDQDA